MHKEREGTKWSRCSDDQGRAEMMSEKAQPWGGRRGIRALQAEGMAWQMPCQESQ